MDLTKTKNFGGAEHPVKRLKPEEVGLGGNVGNPHKQQGPGI